jgi:predicted HAD superfamily Cof-like phosphohydrolase
MSFFDDVDEFHKKMGLEHMGTAPHSCLLTPQLYNYRLNFIFEELKEFIEGHAHADVAQCADALADLIWIACGTAVHMGVDLNAVWAEVKRANMQKRPWVEGDPVKPRNYTASEIVKPKGWKPPDIEGVLGIRDRQLEEFK